MLQTANKTQEKTLRFLVCVNDRMPSRVAIRFASARLRERNGVIDILHVMQPADFQSFSAIADKINEENREKAEAVLNSMAEEVQQWSDTTPSVILREGDVEEEVLKVIDDNPDINMLVLGASPQSLGKREVVSSLAAHLGKKLLIPMLIVPGNLTDQQINELT